MKEVCGYLGLDNKFYKTEKECEKADIEYKIRNITKTLDNFPEKIKYNLFRRNNSDEIITWYEYKDEILSEVCKVIFQEKDNFIKIIEESKKLEEELNKLYDLTYNKSWWMKIKWWK